MAIKIDITFKNMPATASIKSYVRKKAEKLNRLMKYAPRVHAILSIEKLSQVAELTCHADHHEFVARAKSKNMYESIDEAVTKLTLQIKKDRSKRKGQNTAHKMKRTSARKLAQDIEAIVPHRGKRAGVSKDI